MDKLSMNSEFTQYNGLISRNLLFLTKISLSQDINHKNFLHSKMADIIVYSYYMEVCFEINIYNVRILLFQMLYMLNCTFFLVSLSMFK